MRIPFVQIDAFAAAGFTGNPAAVMRLNDWLDDDRLQAIAAENNLSETAFLVTLEHDATADFELRWFTPVCEVMLCGHATLASGHLVLSSDPVLERVRFRTRKAGVLEVERAPVGYRMVLPSWKPSPRPMPAILSALGVAGAAKTLWHAHGYGVVVLENAAAVRRLNPDFRVLGGQGGLLTIVTAPGDDTDVISRTFAPAGGVDEDPVTGSAHSVLTPYWAERLGRDHFTAYQASKRGGFLDCTLAGDQVILGGNCVTVIEGNFLL